MNVKNKHRLLKVIMLIGISLILLGHYLISYLNFDESHGVTGIVISAGCIALGLILSLPTKVYLTLIFMKNESEKDKT